MLFYVYVPNPFHRQKIREKYFWSQSRVDRFKRDCHLIVKYHHETEGHEMGVNFTLNHLREKYFVVQGRQQVKRCIKECAECNRRFRGCPAKHQMAPLPRIRSEMTSIGSRHKWFLPTENIKVGDVVLVIEPDLPRRHWKLGRIEAVYPGRDG